MPPRITIRYLLTSSGLGFCCPWAGLMANRAISSEVLATRLGVSGRAVRYQYDSIASGDLKCEHCRNCMKGALDARKKL
jgi:hypothetical protein